MPSYSHFLASIVLCLSFFSGAVATITRGATVNVRIEGASTTLFEGPVFTRGRNVSTISGGLHVCDGTNDDANVIPGPTVTTALADAAKTGNFTWDGTFDHFYDDFFITKIGSTAAVAQDWGILVNYTFIPSTGCQQVVASHDDVLFADNAFNAEHFLEVSWPGPANTVSPNTPVTLVVTDGMSGDVISGATVSQLNGAASSLSDSSGQATFTFTTPGQYILKASRDDSIRSNAVTVTVVST